MKASLISRFLQNKVREEPAMPEVKEASSSAEQSPKHDETQGKSMVFSFSNVTLRARSSGSSEEGLEIPSEELLETPMAPRRWVPYTPKMSRNPFLWPCD